MNTKRKVWVMALALIFLMTGIGLAADQGSFSTNPTTKDGKKWRIGFYEGGEYIDYQTTLIALVNGLMTLGWIEKMEIPAQTGAQTKQLWNWMAASLKSQYIEFPADAHYSANWNRELRKTMSEELISRLTKKKDIDLMIAAGTWGGQDLASDLHKTPTIVVSTSDPVKANIIASSEDSGRDHVHARVAPMRYELQIKLFHEIIKFKTLGIAYENTETGRIYGSIDKVEKMAQELGFELVTCYTQSDVSDIAVAEESVKKCFEELAKKKVDAIYVTLQRGINKNSIAALVNIANSNKIPTFSQSGINEVRYGFLMSVAQGEFRAVGNFCAQTIAKVFNGAKPRQLNQIFENPQKIAINQKTADIIGFVLSMDLAEIIDESFPDIEVPGK